MVLAALFSFIMICLAIDGILVYRRKRNAAGLSAASLFQGFFDEKTVTMPRGLSYDSGHTWAHMDEYGRIRVGIDDFLQHVIGPITGIIMKHSGESIKKNEPFLTVIQNGKRLELKAPVSGRIRVSNEILQSRAEMINSSPYEKGWVYLIEPSNWKTESRFLYHADRSTRWIQQEFGRMKDFFASLSTSTLGAMPVAVMQDGGILKDQVLSEFGPEIWEEFQNRFLDKANA